MLSWGLGWGYRLGLRCLLDRPQGPSPSILFASDAFFHFLRTLAPLGGPQPQLKGLLAGLHHPGPRGVLCRPKLGLSCQSHGSFPPGTLLFWPTLSLSADSNPHMGLIRMGNGGQSPPRRRAPWPGSHGPLCTRGWHMLLAGRQGPSEPLMHKALCYKDTLPSFLVYGDPQPRGHCAHCEAHQQGRLLPTPCLTVHQPAQTQPPPATPPPYLST